MCRKIVKEEHFTFVRLESKTRSVGPGHELIKLFSSSAQLSMKFSLLINMKMPTIVGIFIFISRENFMLSYVFFFFFFFFLIWVLRPFQEYFTYIEPIVHRRWAKTGEPGEKPPDHP